MAVAVLDGLRGRHRRRLGRGVARPSARQAAASIRIWVDKYEAGAFDEDAAAASTIQEYEARIAEGRVEKKRTGERRERPAPYPEKEQGIAHILDDPESLRELRRRYEERKEEERRRGGRHRSRGRSM